jgi:methylmalonyl-CoA mutase N-terminal domain/subunit
VANTVDPVGGAYAIESLTNRIERDASEWLGRIDARGGVLAAIETGYIQDRIQEAAYEAQRAVDSGAAVVVGVNRFTTSRGPMTADVFRVDPELERLQAERVRAVRAGRSARDVTASLDVIALAARDGTNLVPPIIAAVERHATLGEVADALRAAFGEYPGQ